MHVLCIKYVFKNFQSYEHAINEMKMSEKYASRNCQDGLYIPLLFSALGLDIDNVMAAKDMKGSSVGKSCVT